jgi:hypothetical protein
MTNFEILKSKKRTECNAVESTDPLSSGSFFNIVLSLRKPHLKMASIRPKHVVKLNKENESEFSCVRW